MTANPSFHSPILVEIKRDVGEQRAVVVQDVVHERVGDDLGRRTTERGAGEGYEKGGKRGSES